MLRNARTLLVGAHEDGHVGPVEPSTLVRSVVSKSCHQSVIQQGFPGVLVAILDGLNVDLSLEAAFRLLGLVVVDRLQTRRKAVLQCAKKRVVPRHNGLTAAPVRLEHLVVQGVVKGPLGVGKGALLVVDDARQIQELSVVSVAPAVDGLLAVTHDEGSVAFGQHVVHQRDQVLPLGHRRVLEFIHKHMPVPAAHALKQERHGIVTHHTRHPLVKGVEGSDVSRLLHLLHFFGNHRQGTHQIDLVQDALPQQVRLSACSPGHHVLNLFEDVLCIRGHARHRIHDVVGCRFGGECSVVKHGLQRLGGRNRFAATVLFEPCDQGPTGHVFFGQALVTNGFQGLGDPGRKLLLFPLDLCTNRLGHGAEIGRRHVPQRFQRVPHALFQHLLSIRGQRVADAAVFLFFHLESGKALEQGRQGLLSWGANAVEQVAHGFVDDAVLVELNAVVLIQGQIAGKALHQAVGEAVQRHDRHLSIAVKHGGAQGAGAGRQGVGGEAGLVCEFGHKGLRGLA